MLCTNKKHDCFAERSNGTCHCLSRPCKDNNGICKFYKPKAQREEELKQEAKDFNVDYDEYKKELKASLIIHGKF